MTVTRTAAGTRLPVDPAAATYPALELSSVNVTYRVCGADATRLYLDGGSGQLRSMTGEGVAPVTLKNFTGKYVLRVFETHTAGTVLALVQTGTGDTATYDLYLSTDYGATFGASPVLALGDGNGALGAQSPGVYLLARGICKATIGGQTCLLLGEYNVSATRTAGGEDDRVRIMKSIDNGATWTKVTYLNTTPATTITRHCHGIWQHPSSGRIYLAFGDTGAEVALVSWNGSAAWADDTAWATLATTAGFQVVSNAQRYRTCDLLFETDGLVIPVDSPTANECGIWRCNFNLSNYRRVNSEIEATGQLLMYAVASPSHNYIIGGLYDNTPTGNRYFHSFSAEPGGDWKLVGKISMRVTADADLPYEALWFGGQLVIGGTHLTAADVTRAIIFLNESATETDGATPTVYY